MQSARSTKRSVAGDGVNTKHGDNGAENRSARRPYGNLRERVRIVHTGGDGKWICGHETMN